MAALLVGGVPRRAAIGSAAALAALGGWALLTTLWNGIPVVALDLAGLMVTGAACLLLGSSLHRTLRIPAVAGVAIGLAGHAATTQVIVGTGLFPGDWFNGRQLEGSLGYHNGLAAAYVLGLPLALYFGADARRPIRFAGAAGTVLLLSTVLLTQSRAALLAIGLGVVLMVLLSRSWFTVVGAAALIPVSVVLFLLLRPVDDALVDLIGSTSATPEQGPFTTYVVVTFLLAAAAGALMAVVPAVALGSTRRRVLARVGAAVAVVGVVAATVVIAVNADDLSDRFSVSPNSPSQVEGGSTRLSSLSPTGRLEQWRLAVTMIGEEPARGHGAGTFARRWTIERDNKDLHVLQPHSIELETAAELGVIGTVLLAIAALGVALLLFRGRPGDRRLRVAVAAVALQFSLMASVDWVFSFPLLLGATLLLAGVAGGSGTGRASNSLIVIAGGLAGLVLLAGPALGSWYLDRAVAAGQRSPTEAARLAARARSFNRWDPAIVSFQGRLLEAGGANDRAAAAYARAADLSQQPWLDLYRQARALDSAGRSLASLQACRRAITANPLERILQSGVCDGVEP